MFGTSSRPVGERATRKAAAEHGVGDGGVLDRVIEEIVCTYQALEKIKPPAIGVGSEPSPGASQ